MKLSKIVLAMCLATGIMSTAVAQVVMRNAISVAQNSHAGEAVDTLAREVEKRTNGRIVINFANSSAIPAPVSAFVPPTRCTATAQ